jgi:hypothetical protein
MTKFSLSDRLHELPLPPTCELENSQSLCIVGHGAEADVEDHPDQFLAHALLALTGELKQEVDDFHLIRTQESDSFLSSVSCVFGTRLETKQHKDRGGGEFSGVEAIVVADDEHHVLGPLHVLDVFTVIRAVGAHSRCQLVRAWMETTAWLFSPTIAIRSSTGMGLGLKSSQR